MTITPIPAPTGASAADTSKPFAPGDRVRWHNPPLSEGTVLKNNGGRCKVQWDTGEVRRDDLDMLRHAADKIDTRPFPIAPQVHTAVLTTSPFHPAGTATTSTAVDTAATRNGSDAAPTGASAAGERVSTFDLWHLDALVREWCSSPYYASVPLPLLEGLCDSIRKRLDRADLAALAPHPPAGAVAGPSLGDIMGEATARAVAAARPRPVAWRITLDDGSSSYVEYEADADALAQHYGASVEPLYAELPTSAGAVADHVLVPVEPTREMLKAFCATYLDECEGIRKDGYRPDPGMLARPCWDAMIAARPQVSR